MLDNSPSVALSDMGAGYAAGGGFPSIPCTRTWETPEPGDVSFFTHPTHHRVKIATTVVIIMIVVSDHHIRAACPVTFALYNQGGCVCVSRPPHPPGFVR